MMKFEKMKDIIIIIVLYTISHGLMLFNRGLYWDDWPWFKMDTNLLFDGFAQLGAPWIAYVFNYLFSFDDLIFFRVIVFLAFLFSAVFLFDIVGTIKEIDREKRLLIVVFFAIFPCNALRIAICVTQYAVSYFCFFLGFWVLSKYLARNSILLRITSLLLFFLSFTTNSVLVFYSIILLYILYREKVNVKEYKQIFKISIKYLDFILIPLVFWVVKIKIFPAYGLYSGYNTLRTDFIISSPLNAFYAFYASLFKVVDQSIVNFILVPFSATPTLVMLVLVLSYLIAKKHLNIAIGNEYRKPLILGLFCFYVAVFPYLAVGNNVSWEFLNSRNQLLIPLGISLIIVYGLQHTISWSKLNNHEVIIKRVVYSMLIFLFVSTNISTYIAFQKDWYKQVSVIENIKNNEIIYSNTTFLFKDNLTEMNVFKREYWIYEYTGFLKQAFGDEKRFGSNYEAYNAGDIVARGEHRHRPLYLLTEYKPENPQYLVFIDPGKYKMSTKGVFQLLYYEMVRSARYKAAVKDIVTLHVEKL